MKRFRKIMLLLPILIVAAVLLQSYMHVSGYEIDGISDISVDCVVVVDRLTYQQERMSYSLNSEQMEAFRNLILNTTFVRTFSASYRDREHADSYSAYVNFGDARPNLHIQAVGNQAFAVFEQSYGWMIIQNADWEENLLHILEETGASPN